jgi:hypothetical protein
MGPQLLFVSVDECHSSSAACCLGHFQYLGYATLILFASARFVRSLVGWLIDWLVDWLTRTRSNPGQLQPLGCGNVALVRIDGQCVSDIVVPACTCTSRYSEQKDVEAECTRASPFAEE